MIVILDTSDGKEYNFTTKKAACEYLGISTPTLRGWVKDSFYLYKSLIITHTSNEKVQRSKRALVKKQVEQFRQDEIHRTKVVHVPGLYSDVVPVNGSRPKETADLESK